MNISKPLWICPKCNRPFTNVNQWHSCGRYTLDEFLHNRTDHALGLFQKFVRTLEEIGPFIYAPAKTRIGFQVRMIFAAINRMGMHSISGHLILSLRNESKKFHRIELDIIHHFKIFRSEEIDAEFKSLMQEAYKVGQQNHLERKKEKLA